MKFRYIIISALALACAGFQAGAGNAVSDELEFEKGASSSIESLLRGQLSGVRVSSTEGGVNSILNTNIRGINSLRGSSAPLWIVDGAPLTTAVGEELPGLWQYGDNGYTSTISQMVGFNLYDIESIEVLKNVSATALYGARGANGVIIINTKKAKDGDFNLDWNSNVLFNGSASDSKPSKVFQTVSHNHNLSLSASMGRTNYRISAFFRDNKGVMGDGNSYAGARVNFDSKANSVVWFGLNSNFTVGKFTQETGTAWYGAPSYTLAARGISPLNAYDTSMEGWQNDYDDATTSFRTTDSAYLVFNFTPWLTWKNNIGIDFQTNTRQLWYGNETALGLAYNGVADINYQSLFAYNAKSALDFNFFVAEDHNLKAALAVEVNGDMNKYNNMAGANFSSHALRAKGIQLLGSKTVIRKFEKEFVNWGAYASLGYDYKGITGVDVLIRMDKLPRYQDRLEWYPSANLYFDIRKASFADSDAVSTLRVDAGCGESGRWRYMPFVMFGNYTGGEYVPVHENMQSYYEGFNKLRSSEWNASLTIGFARDRVTLKAGYFDKKTVDALSLFRFGKVINAYSDLWTNCERTDVSYQSSDIANKGVEADIDALLIDGKNVKWNLNLNATYNTNQVVRLDERDVYGLAVDNSALVVNANAEGSSVSSFYGYPSGASAASDKTIIGSSIPKVYGGLNTSLKIFRFDVDARFDGAAGFSILNMNRMMSNSVKDAAYSNFLEKGDYLRLSRLTLAYDIPIKVKWIKSFKASVSGTNLFTLTGYKGWNPDVNSFGANNLSQGIDFGSYPIVRSLIVGVALNF